MALISTSNNAPPFGDHQPQHTGDLRSRFRNYQSLDSSRNEFVNQGSATDLEIDLKDEKESRRRYQKLAEKLNDKVDDTSKSRYVSLLIDADADIYHFAPEFLSGGLEGGKDAADKVLERTKEHLSSLSLKDIKNIPIVVKAYANLSGLKVRLITEGRVNNALEVTQFWIGFTQRHPLIDFVDVGAVKEGADNKIREILRLNINNPQCEHTLLACGHDGGYVPVLNPYAGQDAVYKRITLISGGPGSVHPSVEALRLRSTKVFESLFTASTSPQAELRVTNWTPAVVAKKTPHAPPGLAVQSVNYSSSAASPAPAVPSEFPALNGGTVEFTVKVSKKAAAKGTVTPPTPVKPEIDYTISFYVDKLEKLVENHHRLGPVRRDIHGKRVDGKLHIDYDVVNSIKERKLCQWHYLRSNCKKRVTCGRKHWDYPRPLKAAEYDAVWFLARKGPCEKFNMHGDCEDDHCIYGHWIDTR